MFVNKQYFPAEELGGKLWAISQGAYEFGSPWRVEEFTSDLLNEQSEYVLLVEQGNVIGFVGYRWVLDEAEITNIAVKRDFFGQGYGDRLLEQMMATLEEKEIAQVFLEVRKSNTAAQKLYVKGKFHQVGLRKAYYHGPVEDAVIMCAKVRIVKWRSLQKV